MASGDLLGCIIPVAATEQHLEHLAMEHDARSVTHVAEEVAKQLRPRVVVAPTVSMGISEHHMRHPGTVSLFPGTFLSVLHDAIRCMREAGFENILVLNGHGGNVAPCEGAWGQFLLRLQGNLHFCSYWDLLPKEQAEPHLKTKRYPGHAQEFETAFALAAFPENVRHDAMADQQDKEPLDATEEAGAALIEAIVRNVANYMTEMIEGKRVAEIPPFFV
ncbi:MAG: creatininase family protein [Planctomycetes bacterium]|nr:creatininase family protein [Planctomycetota bacterium]